nr:sodium:calcium antiporter [Parvularcula mediterranea]
MTFTTPLGVIVAFALAAGIILLAGIRLSVVADQLADRTGLGEAIVGSVLLGAATSLSGLTMSVTAAWQGYAELAISNSLGGIAAQTLFLAAADIVYRRANLEHAAASLENMLQGTVLIGALSLIVLAIAVPELSFLGLHPVTPAIFGFYLLGLGVTKNARETPGWRAERTRETETDEPDPQAQDLSLPRLIISFVLLAAVTAMGGFLVSRAAEGAILVFSLSESVAGAFLTAIVTSLPELVTTIAAVRRGALTLAVGGIIGGNAFDTLFVAASDVAYREGSIYAAVGEKQLFLIGLTVAMTAVLLMGLLRRQKEGFGRIGFETVLIIGLYLAGSSILIMR